MLVSIDFNIKNKRSGKKLRDLLSHFSRHRLRSVDFHRPKTGHVARLRSPLWAFCALSDAPRAAPAIAGEFFTTSEGRLSGLSQLQLGDWLGAGRTTSCVID